MGQNKKIACVTLDLEPDHGARTKNYYAHENFIEVANLLSQFNIPLTAFVTGDIIEKNLPIIDTLMGIDTEFELHCYNHKKPDEVNDIKKSIHAYENRFHRRPVGYRGYKYIITDEIIRFLIDEGFLYDSSCVPSFRPFAYNNITARREPHFIGNTNFLEIPLATFPLIRYPVTMSYLQLIGEKGFSIFENLFTLPNPIIFEFHLHDIFLTSSVKELPMMWKKLYLHNHKAGGGAINMLINILQKFISRNYCFINLQSLYQIYRKREYGGSIS